MSTDPRGLDGAWARHQRIGSVPPAPDLAPFVDGCWTVDWHYAEPYLQRIVPYPHVHLTLRTGHETELSGVPSRFVVKELTGTGRVVGIRFRPGGFRPFLGSAVSALTDRTVPASTVLPGLTTGPADVAAVQERLRALAPEPDPAVDDAAGIVALVSADPAVARVEELARRCGYGVRGLQRLFAEYVGIGPKWVIRRYRLHEVTERMARGEPIGWADVAAELGYADQAHLSRDFAAMFGEPPTRYARRYARR